MLIQNKNKLLEIGQKIGQPVKDQSLNSQIAQNVCGLVKAHH